MVPDWRRSGFSAVLGRYDRPPSEDEADENMNPFRIVTSIAEERLDTGAGGGLSEQGGFSTEHSRILFNQGIRRLGAIQDC